MFSVCGTEEKVEEGEEERFGIATTKMGANGRRTSKSLQNSPRSYAKPVKGSAQTGTSSVYRCPETLERELVTAVPDGHEDFNSHWEGFVKCCEKHGDEQVCLGTRKIVEAEGTPGEYEWKTYGQVKREALSLGSGFCNLGLCKQQVIEGVPEQSKYGSSFRFLGISAKSREEWTLCDLACVAFGITSVPLYDTLGDEAVEFILMQTKTETVCADSDCVKKLLMLASRLPSLRTIVCYDPIDDEQRLLAAKTSIELTAFTAVLQNGRDTPQHPVDQKLDFVFTICYTSGTTGLPKGVVLTNGAIRATCGGALIRPDVFRLFPGDVHLSYLPMAHVYERMAQYYCLIQGAAIGFYSGDTLKLLDDIQALRPTMFISVPRLYNRIMDKILSGVTEKGWITHWLFNHGLKSKLQHYRQTGAVAHALYDKIIFSKIQKLLGGRLRVFATGSAPLNPEVQEKMSCMFGCNLVEGWGMTETCAISAVQGEIDHLKGTVGGVCGALEYRLVSVPDMQYNAEDAELPKGELQVRGPSLFSGYFLNPNETAEAFDADGWFKTGDVAEVLPNGALRIIDRKKNIYKLSQGEYVSPERIESVYVQIHLIAQIFVYGNSLQNHLVGIVVPDEAACKEWATKHGKDAEIPLQEMVKDELLQQTIQKEMDELAKEKLKGFERVKAIHLSGEALTVENGLLTATFKVVRHKAGTVFQSQLDRLYEESVGNSANSK